MEPICNKSIRKLYHQRSVNMQNLHISSSKNDTIKEFSDVLKKRSAGLLKNKQKKWVKRNLRYLIYDLAKQISGQDRRIQEIVS